MQLPFTALTLLLLKKCNLLEARVVIYAYQQHVRLLSPEPVVVKPPQSTRVKEPTLLCNQMATSDRRLYPHIHWRSPLDNKLVASGSSGAKVESGLHLYNAEDGTSILAAQPSVLLLSRLFCIVQLVSRESRLGPPAPSASTGVEKL